MIASFLSSILNGALRSPTENTIRRRQDFSCVQILFTVFTTDLTVDVGGLFDRRWLASQLIWGGSWRWLTMTLRHKSAMTHCHFCYALWTENSTDEDLVFSYCRNQFRTFMWQDMPFRQRQQWSHINFPLSTIVKTTTQNRKNVASEHQGLKQYSTKPANNTQSTVSKQR